MPEERTTGARRRLKRGGGASTEAAPKRRRSTGDGGRDASTDSEPREAFEPEGAVQEEEYAEDEPSGAKAEVGDRKQRTVRGELGSMMRDAALEVLGPIAKNTGTQAAQYAREQGPRIAREALEPRLKQLGPKIKQAGGPGEFAKGALSNVSEMGTDFLSKVRGAGGRVGKVGKGTGRSRRLPVQEWVDVAVPLETAYNQFTQFEDFARFMLGAEKIEQRDDTHFEWHENVWGIRRKAEVEITEQRPDERIAWKSHSGFETTGVITFHRLSDRLTRVMVTHDYQPHGLLEKSASGMRMSRRALRSDLIRFKAFIEMGEEETGGRPGRTDEGQVVEGDEREQPRDEEEQYAEPEEPDEEEYEEEEPEPEEEPEEEPVARRRTTRRRAPSRPRQQARPRR